MPLAPRPAADFRRGEPAPELYVTEAVANVVSPIGAGDSFAAGVLACVVSGQPLDHGIRLGMTLGALAVQSEFPYPDSEEVSRVASQEPTQ